MIPIPESRPPRILLAHLECLDEFNAQGINMVYAAPKMLTEAFLGLSKEDAEAAVQYWQKTRGATP